MTDSAHQEFANERARLHCECLLSVLIPFHNVDPSPLLNGLLRCCRHTDVPLEIIAADDGSDSRDCSERVRGLIDSAAVPCRLLVLPRNRGRAAVRNVLCREAVGRFVLYLDGDVEVPDDRFLDNYLNLLVRWAPVVTAGGFRMGMPPATDAHLRLHRYVSQRLHAVPLPLRRQDPAKYAYASNLLVRREVMLAYGFDERFSGWGWEDVELAYRLAERFQIVHIENPVVHAGFQTSRELVQRWMQSIHNFRLLCAIHPRRAATLNVYRASVLLTKLPGLRPLRNLLERVVLQESRLVPLVVRYWSFRLLCAVIYAHRTPVVDDPVNARVLSQTH